MPATTRIRVPKAEIRVSVAGLDPKAEAETLSHLVQAAHDALETAPHVGCARGLHEIGFVPTREPLIEVHVATPPTIAKPSTENHPPKPAPAKPKGPLARATKASSRTKTAKPKSKKSQK